MHFWTIWKKRNQKVFEDEEMSYQRIKSSFLDNLAMWIWVYMNGRSMYLIDCVDWMYSG